jgi:hypothetical protein
LGDERRRRKKKEKDTKKNLASLIIVSFPWQQRTLSLSLQKNKKTTNRPKGSQMSSTAVSNKASPMPTNGTFGDSDSLFCEVERQLQQAVGAELEQVAVRVTERIEGALARSEERILEAVKKLFGDNASALLVERQSAAGASEKDVAALIQAPVILEDAAPSVSAKRAREPSEAEGDQPVPKRAKKSPETDGTTPDLTTTKKKKKTKKKKTKKTKKKVIQTEEEEEEEGENGEKEE